MEGRPTRPEHFVPPTSEFVEKWETWLLTENGERMCETALLHHGFRVKEVGQEAAGPGEGSVSPASPSEPAAPAPSTRPEDLVCT